MSTTATTKFFAWFNSHCDSGERLLKEDLGPSPRSLFFEYNSSDYAHDFFARVDRWSSWRLRLIAGLRRRLREADHLAIEAETRFATDRLLTFHMRMFHDPNVVVPIDLRNRDWILHASGLGYLRELFTHYREEPDWNTVRQNILFDLRRFAEIVKDQGSDLLFAGEPRSPELDSILKYVGDLKYVDVNLVKSDLLAAEKHFMDGPTVAKDVGSAFRRAVEQLIGDAYKEGVKRSQIAPPASTPDVASQSEAIGKNMATKGSARQAYGAFAMLSELGSHPRPIDQEDLDVAWRSAIAGLLMLAKRLPP